MAAAATTKKAFLCRANSPTTTWLSELAFPLATGTVLTDVIGDDTLP